MSHGVGRYKAAGMFVMTLEMSRNPCTASLLLMCFLFNTINSYLECIMPNLRRPKRVYMERVWRESFPRSSNNTEEEEAICVERERDEEGCPQFPAAPLSLYLYCLPPRCAAALSGIQVHFPTSTVCLVLANELLEDQWNQSCKYICILACHLDFGVIMRRGCPVKSLG